MLSHGGRVETPARGIFAMPMSRVCAHMARKVIFITTYFQNGNLYEDDVCT